MVFSEENVWYELYNTFISFLCLVSTYTYMYVATFRNGIKMWNEPLYVFFEVNFAIHMLLQFFKSYFAYGQDSMQKEVKSISQIGMNYLQTFFIIDLIPLIPLQYLDLPNNREKICYMVKIIRLEKGFRLLDVSRFLRVIKKAYFHYLEQKFK